MRGHLNSHVLLPLLLASLLVDDDPQAMFHFSGYVQGRFTNVEDTKDRLEIRRGPLILSGDFDEHVSYTIQTDIAKLPYLLDASVEIKASSSLHITAGQFKLPFSAESLMPDNLVAPVERAKVVNSLVPGRDVGVQARDTGVQISGKAGWIEYAGGAFTGELIVNSPQSTYHSVAGRAIAHLGDFAFGGDVYRSVSALEKTRQSVEARYRHRRFLAQSEFIWGRDAGVDRRGGYELAAWRWSKRWEGVFREDWYTSNLRKRNATTDTWLAGANYYVFPKVRLQANAGVRREPGSAIWSGLVLLQVQAGF